MRDRSLQIVQQTGCKDPTRRQDPPPETPASAAKGDISREEPVTIAQACAGDLTIVVERNRQTNRTFPPEGSRRCRRKTKQHQPSSAIDWRLMVKIAPVRPIRIHRLVEGDNRVAAAVSTYAPGAG